jgi:maltooligosyltrehalose trehalohydrolase
MLREWYRDLLALRRREPALTDGRYEDLPVEVDDDRGTLVYRRGPIAVALNIGVDALTIPRPHPVERWDPILVSERGIRVDETGVWLPPDSVAVLRVSADGS